MNRGLLGAMLVLVTAGTSACPDDDGDAGGSGGGGAGGGAPGWQVIFDAGALDRALLSIWGSGPNDVFAVGGPLGNSGFEALVLHHDGEAWTDLRAGGTDTFWWVHGTKGDDVWMVGERGRITHYDGATFVEHDAGVDATLWGTFAFAADDVWAVGGTPEGTLDQEDDIVLHWDGATWSRVALPGEPKRRALFKIWGTSADDLYVVGEGGIIWHRTHAGFTLESDGDLTSATLFTVNGCGPGEVYAVGGREVLKRSGGAWQKLETTFGNNVNGVACASSGEVVVVGFGGQKQRLTGGVWVDDFLAPPSGDLHAAWADETGAFWTVGGNFVTQPKPGVARNGIIARFGSGKVSDVLK